MILAVLDLSLPCQFFEIFEAGGIIEWFKKHKKFIE